MVSRSLIKFLLLNIMKKARIGVLAEFSLGVGQYFEGVLR